MTPVRYRGGVSDLTAFSPVGMMLLSIEKGFRSVLPE